MTRQVTASSIQKFPLQRFRRSSQLTSDNSSCIIRLSLISHIFQVVHLIMKHTQNPPIYLQVAYDIASKIAAQELKEGQRFTGRSLMGSQYSVSSETIRRAMRLLSDVGIISIQQNVGSVVASRARALEYIEHAKADTNLRAMKTHLQALIAQRDQLNQQISDTITRILDLEERFRHSDQFRTYEFPLEADSPAVGTSIGALCFRQKTGATIIAVRRGTEMEISPGPQTALQAGDVLMVACNVTDISRVEELLG